MHVNGVFEGGGVKGIGLAGAVHAAEKKGVRFNSVAGTSSGSIVAAFLAAGYSGEEMRDLIMSTPFSSFVRPSWLSRIHIVGPLLRLFIKKGLYAGDTLERWVYEKLKAKGVHTFGDLPPNKLRIIASDISLGKLLVLPNDVAQYGFDPMQFPVAKAIRMSTSIPYFFDPVILRKPISVRKSKESFRDQFIYVVDGGILSNFPLWLFDEDEYHGPDLPTLGFMLVGKQDQQPRQIYGPLSMMQALFATMMGAHDERYIEEAYRFRTIKIPTLGVGTTEFHISKEKSLGLYEAGVTAGDKFFEKWSISNYMEHIKRFKRPR